MAERKASMSMNAVVRVASGFGKMVVAIALLPPKALLAERAVAEMLDVPLRTVRRMVVRNELPAPVMLAGKSTWVAHDILAHIKAHPGLAAFYVKREARRIAELSKCSRGARTLQLQVGNSSGSPSGSGAPPL